MKSKRKSSPEEDERLTRSLRAARLILLKLNKSTISLNKSKRSLTKVADRLEAIFGQEAMKPLMRLGITSTRKEQAEATTPEEVKPALVRDLLTSEERNPDRITRPDHYEIDSLLRRIDYLKIQIEKMIKEIEETWEEGALRKDLEQQQAAIRKNKKMDKLYRKLYKNGEPF